MKHEELHTWTIQYDKKLVTPSKYWLLIDELKLFREHWPNAKINADRMGYVTISYACKMTAEAAATQFQQAVKRHDWWREIE